MKGYQNLGHTKWDADGGSRPRLCCGCPLFGPHSHYFPNPLVGRTVKA
jgi:hypothetical protein